jgi:phosphoenolpyruvate synthase/pyruvate phosphate dikinase
MKKERAKSFILWFDEIGIEDISLVGRKNASLIILVNSNATC